MTSDDGVTGTPAPPPRAPAYAPGTTPRYGQAPAEAPGRSPAPAPRRRGGAPWWQIGSWALWDWGSAAFNAVIVTFVFAPYLTSGVAADEVTGSAALGWTTAIAGVVIAVIAPAIGFRADATGRHRLWLGVNSGIVVVCMLGMFFIADSPGFLVPGLLLLGLANIFFELAEVFYNGMLTRISTESTAGRISGLGWGLGYFGGLILLVILLFTVIQPEVGLFGAVDDGGLRYRIVAVCAAVWFAVFALPLILFGPADSPSAPEAPGTSGADAGAGAGTGAGNPAGASGAASSGSPAGASSGFSPVGMARGWFDGFLHVIARIVELFRTDRETLKFFIASAVFRDGLATIFAFAGVIAVGSYGFDGTQVILLGVAANLVAGLGAVIAGFFDDLLGPKTVIVIGLCCLIVGAVPIVVSDSPLVFWITAMWLCLFVGPVQSSSRSFLARITPPERAGENFGLYATTGRAVSFLGPALFAAFVTLLDFQRAGALGIMLVLVAGLLLILPVRPDTARKENVDGVLEEQSAGGG